MNQREWQEAWGADRLVFVPDGPGPLPRAAYRFLHGHGFPWRVIFEGPAPFEISFERLTGNLACFNEVVLSWGNPYDEPLDAAWAPLVVIAEEDFRNGGACYCVHKSTGHVIRIDVELEKPESYVNSSVQRFGHSLLEAVFWSSGNSCGTLEQWRRELADLSLRLKGVDPSAFEDPENHWPKLLDMARSDGFDTFAVTTDPERSRSRF